MDVIERNKELIERFVRLSTCTDHCIDSTYRWFYNNISKSDLIRLNLDKDDIRQDIFLFLLEQKDKLSSRFLVLSLARFMRDRLRSLIYHMKLAEEFAMLQLDACVIDLYGSFDLRWVLSDKRLPLTEYERYILYLSLHRCYTINEICKIVYQDRNTVRGSLKTAREILIKELTK